MKALILVTALTASQFAISQDCPIELEVQTYNKVVDTYTCRASGPECAGFKARQGRVCANKGPGWSPSGELGCVKTEVVEYYTAEAVSTALQTLAQCNAKAIRELK